METRQLLHWYCRTIELGSFSAAARKLDLMPSSLSRAIAQLEEELGVRLLVRNTRRLAPTEAGQTYYQHALALLSGMDAARQAAQELQSEPSGTLRVTAPPLLGRRLVLPLLPLFSERYPRINLELRLTRDAIDLPRSGTDVALRVTKAPPNEPYHSELLGQYQRLICASPAYLARHGTPQHPNDLKQHRCLTILELDETRAWRFRDGEQLFSVDIPCRHSVNQGDVLLDMAEAGMGIAFAGDYVCGDLLASGRLVRLLQRYTIAEPLSLYALYPPLSLPAKTRLFLDHLRERLALGPKTGF
ncbi:LysR substrate-binding domain-containing protein [Chitinimonas sp.]|uniref:LysR family transcriptional regulator n=1 Tax=Chitinimonas sp. TaxID=1934313 RepID=UPI0035B21C19